MGAQNIRTLKHVCVYNRKGIIENIQMRNRFPVNFVPDGIYTTHYCTCFFLSCVLCVDFLIRVRVKITRVGHTRMKSHTRVWYVRKGLYRVVI